jgi:hypothetical protein
LCFLLFAGQHSSFEASRKNNEVRITVRTSLTKREINYFCEPLGAVLVPGCVAPCDELWWQQFFPLPFWQHCFAPLSLLHIFAPFSSQHFLSQPPLQHFSPLQMPFRAIGQFAPMGACEG